MTPARTGVLIVLILLIGSAGMYLRSRNKSPDFLQHKDSVIYAGPVLTDGEVDSILADLKKSREQRLYERRLELDSTRLDSDQLYMYDDTLMTVAYLKERMNRDDQSFKTNEVILANDSRIFPTPYNETDKIIRYYDQLCRDSIGKIYNRWRSTTSR